MQDPDHEILVIGGGAAGEAAASLGGEMGAGVALVEKDLVGGECSFWACMPSKTLLDCASQRAKGADYPWERASARRDWMISREGIDYPDDSLHVQRLENTGAKLIRGAARVTGRGTVEIRCEGELPRTIRAGALIVCTGSVPTLPDISGLDTVGFWTNREATATRELPGSLLILGGGPMGVEAAQYFVRFGVKVTIVENHDRVLPRDHPRSSRTVHDQLEQEGVRIKLGVRAVAARRDHRSRVLEMSDGTTAEGDELMVAVGRHNDLGRLGLEEAGIEDLDSGPVRHDAQMRIGDGVFIAGDAAGGLQFTHLADYQGRIAVRAALGGQARADLGSVPKATYTDPETGAVGLLIEEAEAAGLDAFEVFSDFAGTSRGMTLEGATGHISAVIDRDRGTLAGAFAACRGASELIHEAVVAIKGRIPVSVLADTIHAFPTASRAFGNLMSEAQKQLSEGSGRKRV